MSIFSPAVEQQLREIVDSCAVKTAKTLAFLWELGLYVGAASAVHILLGRAAEAFSYEWVKLLLGSADALLVAVLASLACIHIVAGGLEMFCPLWDAVQHRYRHLRGHKDKE